jgi:hypothetical protein
MMPTDLPAPSAGVKCAGPVSGLADSTGSDSYIDPPEPSQFPSGSGFEVPYQENRHVAHRCGAAPEFHQLPDIQN